MSHAKALNDFQIKSIISQLPNYDIVNIIECSSDGEDIKYACFFNYNNRIFVIDCDFNRAIVGTNLPDINKILLKLKEELEDKISYLDSKIFANANYTYSSRSEIATSLGHFILDEAWIYSRFDYFERLAGDIFRFSCVDFATAFLNKSDFIFDAYEKTMAVYDLDNNNVEKFLQSYMKD